MGDETGTVAATERAADADAVAVPLRLGVTRPTTTLPVVAEAERRVLERALGDRLGDVVVVLRQPAPPPGDTATAAGDGIVGDRVATDGLATDAELDPVALWGPGMPPLTAFFGDTVDPVAAEVRARMLRHLGILPDAPFTLHTDRLARLADLALRPTDIWLVARAAGVVTVADPAVVGLAAAPTDSDRAALARAVDRAVEQLGALATDARDAAIARLRARVARLSIEVARLEAELVRSQREAADRLDQLAGERAVLAERLARSELSR